MSARRDPTTAGTSSREAFVSSTAKLLRRQGYAATGLNEIVARSGAPRGSLYFHFPGGKQELALAAMEHSGEQLRGAIAAVMASPGGAARTVGGLIDALAAGLEASGYRDGCPIATVTLEAAAGSEPVRLTAERVFSSWLSELESALVAEGAEPEAARRRAMLVLAAAEGGLLLARAQRDTAPLTAVRDELQNLLA
ncbi:MAG TPA: TetR/AcrR family transcriptional regulator [Solirubrobacteraceae bacterium]|nr:TetR/AcrR family transcriptional regulator [Solirubrobacteraceae bacterium]